MTGRKLLKTWLTLQEDAERPFVRFGDHVPSADLDISNAMTEPVIAPDGPPETGAFDDFVIKGRNLARSFAGKPDLHLVNAKLITLLRRRDPPPHASGLFAAIWDQKHEELARTLPMRWIISAAMTLEVHGSSEVLRRTATSIGLLCNLMKLYESERHAFGGEETGKFRPFTSDPALPLDMSGYAIVRGDLDRVLITRIWQSGQSDPAARSLLERVIPALLEDQRGVFNRLQLRRKRRHMRLSNKGGT